MRTEKWIRNELQAYKYFRDYDQSLLDQAKEGTAIHKDLTESIYGTDRLINLLESVLATPRLIECPYCHAKEEPLWAGMYYIECDCGAKYAGEVGWSKKDGTF